MRAYLRARACLHARCLPSCACVLTCVRAGARACDLECLRWLTCGGGEGGGDETVYLRARVRTGLECLGGLTKVSRPVNIFSSLNLIEKVKQSEATLLLGDTAKAGSSRESQPYSNKPAYRSLLLCLFSSLHVSSSFKAGSSRESQPYSNKPAYRHSSESPPPSFLPCTCPSLSPPVTPSLPPSLAHDSLSFPPTHHQRLPVFAVCQNACGVGIELSIHNRDGSTLPEASCYSYLLMILETLSSSLHMSLLLCLFSSLHMSFLLCLFSSLHMSLLLYPFLLCLSSSLHILCICFLKFLLLSCLSRACTQAPEPA